VIQKQTNKQKKNRKAIPVTGRRGLEDYETSRFPSVLDNRLTDSVCQPYAPAAFNLQKDLLIFLLEIE
jgi:hypothetical protein